MIKIIADDKIPYLKGVLEPYADIQYLPGAQITKEQVKEADALIIRTRTRCNAQLLEGSKVTFIATATIGFDHIDTSWCEQHGITWTNAPGCNSSSVQQYIAAAIAYLAVKHKFSFRDKTIGIIGVGNVGSKIATLADILGMKYLLNDPPRARKEGNKNFIPLEELLAASDIITFHVPLQKEGEDATWKMADTMFLQNIKKGAFVLNSSRGEIVDNKALKEILQTRHLGGTVLDVWENEPDIDLELLNLLDLATPHIAGYSYDGKANGTAMSIQALSHFFQLPLTHWYPTNIEKPISSECFIECAGKSFEEIMYEAISLSYDIKRDDSNLRQNPAEFEKQRGDYAIRREFPAYTLKLKNDNTQIREVFQKLGFTIKQ